MHIYKLENTEKERGICIAAPAKKLKWLGIELSAKFTTTTNEENNMKNAKRNTSPAFE